MNVRGCKRLTRLVACACLCFAAGCASDKHPTTRPSSVSDRQEDALRDPFGYSPNMGNADISGGKIDQFDKDAMRRDLDHVLNP